jgi:hypothetical protein
MHADDPPNPDARPVRHHLVVVREPYLGDILAGRKTMECRLSSRARPDFAAAAAGDWLWLKRPSGPICGAVRVRAARLVSPAGPDEVRRIADRYAREIRADRSFWVGTDWVRTIGLFALDEVLALSPLRVLKSDRRAWVVLPDAPRPLAADTGRDADPARRSPPAAETVRYGVSRLATPRPSSSPMKWKN